MKESKCRAGSVFPYKELRIRIQEAKTLRLLGLRNTGSENIKRFTEIAPDDRFTAKLYTVQIYLLNKIQESNFLVNSGITKITGFPKVLTNVADKLYEKQERRFSNLEMSKMPANEI